MATDTAVVSLMQDLDQLRSSFRRIFGSEQRFYYPLTMEEIEILYDTVSLMDSLLRDSSGESYNHELMDQILEKRIRDASYKAGNYVDFWAVRSLSGLAPHRIEYDTMMIDVESYLYSLDTVTECKPAKEPFVNPSLTEIIQEIGCINEELKKIHDDRKVHDLEDAASTGQSFNFLNPSRRTPYTEGKLVGLENDLVKMLDCLTGHPSQLKVFPIIGMGGIGKTTFAKKLYDNPLVMHHFYVRLWVAVSQQYQVREMLLDCLGCVTNLSDEIYKRSDEQLREQVYTNLKGKRYLVVLDDMWDTKAWDDLKRIFPDDQNGSRIMLTSRNRDVVVHASQDTPPHCLRCLSIHESWELLSSKIFLDESCPGELLAIGKEIAYKCQGLPLAIVVIGGLLSKMSKKLDLWEEVGRGVGSLVMEEAEHCQNILALSYDHLPDHLKACFLYMGMFPEDYEISVKKLIWLWVAEGFIRPSNLKSLEEVAEDYLEDLITRSLILVKRKGSDGRIKTCYIHDLMRELCLSVSQKENFLHVINSCRGLPKQNLHHGLIQVPHDNSHDLRRLSFHSSIRKYINNASFPYTRSVMCFEKLSFSDPRSHLGMAFKLLKVLDIMNIRLGMLPSEITELTQLKFLALTIEKSSHVMFLFTILSLQTLIVDCEWDGCLPTTFWNMLELRHFHLKRSCLSYSPTYSTSVGFLSPSTSILDQFYAGHHPLCVQNNLQSLSTIRPISCTKRVFLSMPNLIKLGVYETEEDYKFRGWYIFLIHLQKLEKLKYVFSNPFVSSDLKPYRLPPWNIFPPKLMKLTLSGTSLPWEDMYKLGRLPKLEVLKLRNYAFAGEVCKSREGGFPRLKFLLIGSTNLETWEADGNPFPNLQHLVLRHCRSLKQIPYGVGEAPLLEKIELHCCKDSAVISARQLQDEQESLGNDGLLVHITEA